jgi:hypothetical protein
MREISLVLTFKQGTGAAKKDSGTASSLSSSSSDVETEIETEIESLTGVNLGSLGLRSLPVLEARKGKKKNGTAVATGAAVSGPRQHRDFSPEENQSYENMVTDYCSRPLEQG